MLHEEHGRGRREWGADESEDGSRGRLRRQDARVRERFLGELERTRQAVRRGREVADEAAVEDEERGLRTMTMIGPRGRMGGRAWDVERVGHYRAVDEGARGWGGK